MQPSAELRMTLEEYLTFEATSPEAHEYRNGFVVARAFPTGAHAIVAMNLSLEIAPAARASGCLAFAGDVTVVTLDSRRRSIRVFERTSDARFASSGPLGVLDLPRLGRSPILAEDIYRDANVPVLDDVSPST